MIFGTPLTPPFRRPAQSCVCGRPATESRNQTRWGRRSAPGRRTPCHHSSWRRSSGCQCSAKKGWVNAQMTDAGSRFGALFGPTSVFLLPNTNQMSERKTPFPPHPFFTLSQVEHLRAYGRHVPIYLPFHGRTRARRLRAVPGYRAAIILCIRFRGTLETCEMHYVQMSPGIDWIWYK